VNVSLRRGMAAESATFQKLKRRPSSARGRKIVIEPDELEEHADFLSAVAGAGDDRKTLHRLVERASVEELRLLAKLATTVIYLKGDPPEQLLEALRRSRRRRSIKKTFGFKTRVLRLLNDPKTLKKEVKLLIPFLSAITECFAGPAAEVSKGEKEKHGAAGESGREGVHQPRDV